MNAARCLGPLPDRVRGDDPARTFEVLKTSKVLHPGPGLVLAAGAAVRLFRLGADSLWYDETVSAYLAGSPLPELIRHTAGDIHPPGYYILLRGWLLLAGYPAGRADPGGSGLEFMAGFFSLFFGVLLVALVYPLARHLAGRRIALIACALVAFSPVNIWYSQEVRMYTLAAGLGAVAVYALLHAVAARKCFWWLVYALAAAAGMYTAYYFAFLLIPLSLWALIRPDRRKVNAQSLICWLGAHLTALLLYAPWLPIAYRQATNPPVPPWRAAPDIFAALRESWAALSLGQSAPGWLWPALVLTLGLYGLGLFELTGRGQAPARRHRGAADGWPQATRVAECALLPLATFGPLALILLISGLGAPLYHVRYLFMYSPAFFVTLAAGLGWLWRRWRPIALSAALLWGAASSVTLHRFWFDPAYRADDHRAAVRSLQNQWRPGDVVLVNAGWAYTALMTYWDGPVAGISRLTDSLPAPGSGPGLVAVTTGHLDGKLSLGWGDPRSDFFALSASVAERQVAGLFEGFERVWHYRIYDTVNDPSGRLRGWLAAGGRVLEDVVFGGEANLRVQRYASRRDAAWSADRPAHRYALGVSLQPDQPPAHSEAGQTVYSSLVWRVDRDPGRDIATSLRLVAKDGATWAQPPDEYPLGPLFMSSSWSSGQTLRQPIALPVPLGTPPGDYTIALLAYDPATGAPYPPQASSGAVPGLPDALPLGSLAVERPSAAPQMQKALAQLDPLALVKASSPATVVSPGSQIPVDLLWQVVRPPGEPLVIVLQLLGSGERLCANLEEEPVHGLYPTQQWTAGELVRDRHVLNLPPDIPAGNYRLVVGAYRAADRSRLPVQAGLLRPDTYWVVKTVQVGP